MEAPDKVALLEGTAAAPEARVVKLFESEHHQVSVTRFRTSTDPRGYIPVFEYTLKSGQTMMIDSETGYVHFTGIWKAVSDTKPDVARLLEASPELTDRIRKVRGGHLKIQGTWLPFDIAETLSRRVAFAIRDDLIPLFGPSFPDTCLKPTDKGYGELHLSTASSSPSASYNITQRTPQTARPPQRIRASTPTPPRPPARVKSDSYIPPRTPKVVTPTRHTHRRRSYSSLPDRSPPKFYDVAFVPAPRRASISAGPVYVPRSSWNRNRYSPYVGAHSAYEASLMRFPQSGTRSTYDPDEQESEGQKEEMEGMEGVPSTPPPRTYRTTIHSKHYVTSIKSFPPPPPPTPRLQFYSPTPIAPINYPRPSTIPPPHSHSSPYQFPSPYDPSPFDLPSFANLSPLAPTSYRPLFPSSGRQFPEPTRSTSNDHQTDHGASWDRAARENRASWEREIPPPWSRHYAATPPPPSYPPPTYPPSSYRPSEPYQRGEDW